MPSLRFTEVPQPVIPNQRNDEVIFVLSRKHFIDYLPFALILGALIIIPIGAVLIGIGSLMVFLETSGVLIRDIIILIFIAYYLILAGIFINSWVSFYFYLFVVTNERVIEIQQRGLFNREFNELDFNQIEDISSMTTGFLNTFFNVGDIQIQTAGKVAYFSIERVWRPQLAVEIIHSLTHQAKDGVSFQDRFPDLETIGSINGRYITRSSRCLPIMNAEKNLRQKTQNYKQVINVARTLREKLDRWWWRHNDQMVATFGPHVHDSEEEAGGSNDYSPHINDQEVTEKREFESAPTVPDLNQLAEKDDKSDDELTPIEEEKETEEKK